MSLHVTKLSHLSDREILTLVSALYDPTDLELELMMRLDDALEQLATLEDEEDRIVVETKFKEAA